MTRQSDMIDALLDRGADIEARRADGARPLQLCNGDYNYRGWRDVPQDTVATPRDIFNHLLLHGASLDINMAALTGNIERVRELLVEDPSRANKLSDYVTYYNGSGSPLNNAVAGGYIDIVGLLLEHGANPSLPEPGLAPRGHALYTAVANKQIEIARLLLEHGAFPNPEVESSADALSRAISNDDKPMIELLCSYGATRKVHLLAYYGDIQTASAVFAANPALSWNVNALETAAGEGHEAFVGLMLRYQPELAQHIAVGVKSRGPEGAIQSREFANYLFEQGMNASFRNWLGITPLHVFAKRSDLENLSIFLEHGANINEVDDEFYSTPLGYAAKYNQPRAAEFLLQLGAAPEKAGAPWAMPLAWATRRGYEEIIYLLKKYG